MKYQGMKLKTTQGQNQDQQADKKTNKRMHFSRLFTPDINYTIVPVADIGMLAATIPLRI